MMAPLVLFSALAAGRAHAADAPAPPAATTELLRTRRPSEISALVPGGSYYERYEPVGTPQDAARMEPGGAASIDISSTPWKAVIDGVTYHSSDGGVTWTPVADSTRPARTTPSGTVNAGSSGTNTATASGPPPLTASEEKSAAREKIIETERRSTYMEVGWVPDSGFSLGLALQPWELGRRRFVLGGEVAVWQTTEYDAHGTVSGYAGYQLWLTSWLVPFLRAHIVGEADVERTGFKAQAGVSLYVGEYLTGYAATDLAGVNVTPHASLGVSFGI